MIYEKELEKWLNDYKELRKNISQTFFGGEAYAGSTLDLLEEAYEIILKLMEEQNVSTRNF